MALKRKITKAEFDALKADVKTEYAVDPANPESYLLDVDDSSGLAAALREEREARRLEKVELDRIKAEKKAADDETARIAAEAETERAKKAGDITALETSWQGKVKTAEDEGNAKNEKLSGALKKLLVDNVAQTIANEISTAPKLLIPHIKLRLIAELEGDEPVTRVVDLAGKPTALTIEDLKKEFVANKDFAAIIKGSGASGGSSGQGQGDGQGSGDKKLSEMGDAERKALHAKDPAAFNALVAADKAANNARH